MDRYDFRRFLDFRGFNSYILIERQDINAACCLPVRLTGIYFEHYAIRQSTFLTEDQMSTAKQTVSLIVVILLLNTASFAVMSPSQDIFLPANAPEAYTLLGQVSISPTAWKVFQARDNTPDWQSFRYELNSNIAMTVGSPIRITRNTDDEAILARDAISFVRNHEVEFGMVGCDLEAVSVRSVRNINVVYLQPRINDVPVYSGYVVLSVNGDGGLSMVKARCFGSDIVGEFSLSHARAVSIARHAVGVNDGGSDVCEVYLPQTEGDNRIVLRATYEVSLTPTDPGFRPVIFVDGQSGEILAAENRVWFDRLDGQTSGLYKSLYRRDESVLGIFSNEWLRLERYGDGYSDDEGEFDYDVNPGFLPISLFTELSGRYVDVDYEDGDDGQITIRIDALDPLEIIWREHNARDDERSLFYHVNFIHDFWMHLDGDLPNLDYPMPAVCMYGDSYDNAFCNGFGVYFGGGYELDNFALYADIVYHEYGHAVTARIYPRDLLPYTGESGALNEAWSDYFPCSITDEPLMGEGGLVGGGYIRNLDNDYVYPDDIQDEVHRDSRIISGAMWHTREVLGRQITDPLFHYTRYELGNNFMLYFTDILLTDDNDGDITNGTPHDRTLYEQFGRHGIGPGIHPDIIMTRLDMYDDESAGAHGNDNKLWEPGETIRIEMELFRDGMLYPPAAEDVRVMIHSDRDDVIPVRDEIGFGDMRVGDRVDCGQPLLFRVDEDAPLCFASIFFTIRFDDDYLVRQDTLRIPLGRPGLLLVKDGDEGKDRSHWIKSALDGLGQVYVDHSTAAPITPLSQRMQGVQTVVWFSGDTEHDILSEGDRSDLMGFLENGGNLLMTGQSLGSSLGAEPFFNEYLGVRHEVDSLHQFWIEGVEDDPVAQGLQLLLLGARGAQNQRRPAAIASIEPAVEIYHWTRADGNPAAGVRREDPETGARTVYFSFGIEGVGGHGYTATRTEVMQYALNWLGVITAVEDQDVSAPVSFTLDDPYPNPFNSTAAIGYSLPYPAHISLSVFNSLGRRIVSLFNGYRQSGVHTVSLAADDLAAGLYFVRLEVFETRTASYTGHPASYPGHTGVIMTRKAVVVK